MTNTLRFVYRMSFSYDEPVNHHHIFLRCFPQNTGRQRIEELRYEIEPKIRLQLDQDHFGNKTASGLIAEAHTEFYVVVKGKAYTGLAVYEGIETDPMAYSLFRYPSHYTQMGPVLQALHRSLELEQESGVYEKVLKIMRSLNRAMTYQTEVTDVHTTAEEALEKGQGVCQDYAHIMLALCRREGIPARYVVGLMKGEGVTHGWVEAMCKDYWYGFDPTNNLLVNDAYIKFSHGRDYEDCQVNKGFFWGTAKQVQEIEALVEVQ